MLPRASCFAATSRALSLAGLRTTGWGLTRMARMAEGAGAGKWALREESLWSTITPIIKASRLCGTAPFAIVKQRALPGPGPAPRPGAAAVGSVGLRYSRFWMTYCCCLISAVLFLNVATLREYQDLMRRDVRGKVKVMRSVAIFVSDSELFAIILTSFFKCVLSLRRAPALLELVTTLGCHSARDVASPVASMRRHGLLVLTGTQALILTMIVYEYGGELLLKGDTLWTCFIILVTGLSHWVNAGLAVTVDVCYIMWVFVLEQRLRQVNINIASLSLQPTTPSPWSSPSPPTPGAFCPCSLVRTHATNRFMSCSTTPLAQRSPLHLPKVIRVNVLDGGAGAKRNRIRGLRDTVSQIHATARLVDETYRTIVMLSAIYVFFSTINAVYFLINTALGEEHNVSWLVANFMYALVHIVLFMFMVFKCTAAISEADRAPELVHALLNKEVSPQAKDELEIFSLQLLHRKVNFTAGGVFKMDYSLLFKLIGGVATYMVVLLQIQPQLEQRTNSS